MLQPSRTQSKLNTWEARATSALSSLFAKPCMRGPQQQQQHVVTVQQHSGGVVSSWWFRGAQSATPSPAACDGGGSSGAGGSGLGNSRRRHGGGSSGDGEGPWDPSGDSNGSSSNTTGTHLLQQVLTLLAGVSFMPVLLPAPAAAAAAATTSKRSFFVSHQDEKLLNASSSWQLDAFVDRMWELSGPILNNMGFSGLLGACAAAALKWVGRTLAASVGLGLVLVQVLSHYGVITVNWSIVHKQARQVLDTTRDGRLDQDDFKRVVKQGLVVLTEGVPSVSGFLVGFLVGMKVF